MFSEISIKGTCFEMCPGEERDLREREGLLHRFEVADGFDGKRKKKADPKKTVKCYSRPAAGRITPPGHLLRPFPILLQTVQYLLQEVTLRADAHLLDVYEFVSDRLRSVRQDMTIQRLSPQLCIPLLEPMVRFYVVYSYLLSTNASFDNYLNDTQLNEVFHRLLLCYETEQTENQLEMESIYMCLNINRPEVVLKQIEFQKFDVRLQLLIAWSVKNSIRVFRLCQQLPVVAVLGLSRHVPNLRLKCLRSWCIAFSSANSRYPHAHLARKLSYRSSSDLVTDCRALGIKFDDDFVNFNKKDLVAAEGNLKNWWLADFMFNSCGGLVLLSENSCSLTESISKLRV